MTTWLVVACNRPRLPDLRGCLEVLNWPASGYPLVLVTTEPEPIHVDDLDGDALIVNAGPGINLARWYNLGVDTAAGCGADEILWLESDVRITPDAVDALRKALYVHDLAMVGPDYYGRVPVGEVLIRREPRPFDIHERVCQCSMVRGTSDLRMDEGMAWWFEADDLEYRARVAGGTGLVADAHATHPFSGTTPLAGDEIRAEAIRAGRDLFYQRWGCYPH